MKPQNIGEKLKRIREEKKLTQRELAMKMGVSASTVGMYEQGRRVPDAEALRRMADALDVSVDALMRDKSETVDEFIESMRKSLAAGGDVMFNGEPLSKEDIDAVVEAMKLGAQIALANRRREE